MPALTETLLDLIEASDYSIREIAEKSGVPYQNLRRFVKGRRGKPGGRSNRSYSVDDADTVYRFLSGKDYVEGDA